LIIESEKSAEQAAAGDVICGALQVVSPAGEGCIAALEAIAYPRKTDPAL